MAGKYHQSIHLIFIHISFFLTLKTSQMDILPLVIQLVSGAAGGNLAGKLMPKNSMGTLLNSVVGILGGGLGGQVLGMLGMGGGADAASGLDIGSIISSIAGGGIGGGILMAIVGYIKGMMKK